VKSLCDPCRHEKMQKEEEKEKKKELPALKLNEESGV
jgi:hypothetical protein